MPSPLAGLAAALLTAAPAGPLPAPTAAQRQAYWNQGKAEITRFELQQARYGELHPGDAVLIFVTEPFSRAKRVKLDDPSRSPDDAVEVLKLNFTRKFETGLYPYSILTSVFTPTDGTPTVKVSSTTQEWCGHVFMQLGRVGGPQGSLQGELRSYFEAEGDVPLSVPAGVMLEDEVWTQLRLDPGRLPVGEVKMLPGLTFLRLRHIPAEPRRAQASLQRVAEGRVAYEVRYQDLERTLRIEFEDRFPFRILAFTERHPSGFGPGATPLTTTGTRREELMIDYWNRHRADDAALRRQLGL